MKSLSRVRLFVTPWTVAYQAPLSMGFSRQEYWSGLPFPSPGDLPDPGIQPEFPALEADALTSELPGKLTLNSCKNNNNQKKPLNNHIYNWKGILFCPGMYKHIFSSIGMTWGKCLLLSSMRHARPCPLNNSSAPPHHVTTQIASPPKSPTCPLGYFSGLRIIRINVSSSVRLRKITVWKTEWRKMTFPKKG